MPHGKGDHLVGVCGGGKHAVNVLGSRIHHRYRALIEMRSFEEK